MVLNNRLSSVAEEEGLIADEQGGFRKRRGCRDQVLTLVLLRQIDFSKAYDKVDRRKLWSCLEGLGINGKFLHFLKALYEGPPAVSKWEVNRVRSFRSMLVFVRAVSSFSCYSPFT